MFAPDSYALNPQGIRILDLISPAIKATQEYVGSIQIQGHTADVGGAANLGFDDWELSSLRASEVTKYLDHIKNMADSHKFRTEGFGKYHPIESNETLEGRAANRRVEIIINRCPDLPREVDRFIRDVMAFDYNQPHREVDVEGGIIQQPGRPIGSVVEGIKNELWDRYGDRRSTYYDVPDRGVVGPAPDSFGQLTERDFIPTEELYDDDVYYDGDIPEEDAED